MKLQLPWFVALAALALTAGAQTFVRSVNGPAVGSQFGKACIIVPDQNADGLKDVLVGAPEFNGGRGAIYCISGAFLATGIGVQTLWSIAPPVAAGDQFGFALADVGDVTGDAVHDFLVGQPGYDVQSQTNVGAVRLVNGSSHILVSLLYGSYACCEAFGRAMAACGDINQNGIADVAVGSPFFGLGEGVVRILDGSVLTQFGSVQNLPLGWLSGGNYGDSLGFSVAAGADLNGDGVPEVVAGVPNRDINSVGDAGRLILRDFAASQEVVIDSGIGGEHWGASVSMGDDYDGDGVADIIAGAPNSPNGSIYEVGRVTVLSGARVMAQQPPYEIYSFAYGSVTPPTNHGDPLPNFHFGAAVLACADLNLDGVGEIMIGAPGYFSTSFSGTSFRGLVRIYSGATGALLCSVTGGTTDRLGDALAGAVGDLDGDGFPEFVVGGSLSDAGGTDSGVIKCYRLFPLSPKTYCIGKQNSLGCTPFVTFSGTPDINSSLPFTITGNNFINHRSGLLFYSRGPSAVPFQGGTKCAANPVRRTTTQDSGGSASGSDCSGSYTLDFNAWLAAGSDSSLAAGADVYAQFWSRDPASPSTTSLSNALHFVIHP
ncbi:MAG: hypothetical protein NTV21_12705 [Planctomycetota bacterium]|nr:hypothetical protein [Planctomycetota bacterium]